MTPQFLVKRDVGIFCKFVLGDEITAGAKLY